jgi:hypothetical protein
MEFRNKAKFAFTVKKVFVKNNIILKLFSVSIIGFVLNIKLFAEALLYGKI